MSFLFSLWSPCGLGLAGRGLAVGTLVFLMVGMESVRAQDANRDPSRHSFALRTPVPTDTLKPTAEPLGTALHLGPGSTIRTGAAPSSLGPFYVETDPWEQMNDGTALLVLGVKLARWVHCKNLGLSRFGCQERTQPNRPLLEDPSLYAPVGPLDSASPRR